MDLSAEFGIPVGQLRRQMKEREFYDWARYARQRGGTPLQRIEILLARIAAGIDAGLLGKKGVRLDQYLRTEEERQRSAGVDMESAFGSGTVIRMPNRGG
jgi:hypothetical protein